MEKVSFICSKGSLDMAYPGLIMGNAARMVGIEVNMFFTFWGMDIINKKKMGKLKLATVGNPSMGVPTVLGSIPGMSAFATSQMKKSLEELDVPDVPEFLDTLRDAGTKMYACALAAEMFKLKKEDFHDSIQGIITAPEFFEIADGGPIVFI
jgi:peroxiredoxin family protein